MYVLVPNNRTFLSDYTAVSFELVLPAQQFQIWILPDPQCNKQCLSNSEFEATTNELTTTVGVGSERKQS